MLFVSGERAARELVMQYKIPIPNDSATQKTDFYSTLLKVLQALLKYFSF